MKKLLTFFLLFFSIYSFSQKSTLDSLLNLYSSSNDDSNKVIVAYNLGGYYKKKNNIDSSIFYAKKTLEISNQIKWNKGKMSYYLLMSSIIGGTGNYPLALELLFKALKLSEKEKDIKSQSSIYVSIGRFYGQLADYDEAIKNYFQAINLRKQSGEDFYFGMYNGIADAFYNKKNYDSALIFQTKALEIALKNKRKSDLSITSCNLGNIYSKTGKINLANEYYKESLIYAIETNYSALTSEIYFGLANNYKTMNNDSSLYFAQKAFQYSSQSNNSIILPQSLILLINHFKKNKEFDSLSKYQEKYINYKEMFSGNEKQKKLEELRINEVYRQQERIINEAKEKKNRNNLLQIIAISIFILSLILTMTIVIKKKIQSSFFRYLGTLTVVLLFAFFSFLISPYIGKITEETPIFVLAASILSSFIISPIQKKAKQYINRKL